ncbi:nucleoporin Nup85-like protein [Phlyctochytrium arcticum]|nr:nucleoporin Nup85-like protein [Phlyctochytrium arcticum]
MVSTADGVAAPAPRETIHLDICAAGASSFLSDKGRTLSAALRPNSNDVLCYIAARDPKPGKRTRENFPKDQLLETERKADDIPARRVPFINKTFAIFAELQVRIRSSKDVQRMQGIRRSTGSRMVVDGPVLADEHRRAITRASGLYRAEIRSFAVYQALDTTETQVFVTAHAALQLLEILYFGEVVPDTAGRSHWNHVQEDIRKFVAENYDAPDRESFGNFRQSVRHHEHPDYWKYINQFLLRGHIRIAIWLLGRHPDCQQPRMTTRAADVAGEKVVLTHIEQLLHEFPRPHAYRTQSEFENKFATWKDRVKALNTERYLTGNRDAKQIATILDILEGKESVICRVAEDWREAMVGMLLFSRPTLKAHEVCELLERIPKQLISEWDVQTQVEVAIINNNFPRVLKLCAGLNWWWLVAHLTDLLHHYGGLDETVNPTIPGIVVSQNQCTQREWYLLGYADQLISNPPLWRLGLEYYIFCPQSGRDMVQAIIPHIPIKSELQSKKLISFCRRHGLEDTRRELHRTIATARYKAGRVGEALEHYIDARDESRVVYLVEELMNRYMKDADLTWSEIAARLGPEALEWNGHLAFLARYREFHELYNAKRYRESAQLLVRLLTSTFKDVEPLFPRRLVMLGLLDSLPLLQAPRGEVMFNTEETFELMRCLEEIIISHRRQEYLGAWQAAVSGKEKPDKSDAEVGEARLQVVRVHLVRNLSRAIYTYND